VTQRKPIEALFAPRSIAVVGASRTPGKIGHTVLRNLVEGGFGGRIYAVNPKGDKVLGRVCHPTIGSVGGPVDVVVVAVPLAQTERVVEDALRVPAKALVVISAGFRESGPEGAAREEALAEKCRKAGVLLLGPNCYGVLNTALGMNASFAREMPSAGGISMVSQSGALCTAFLDWAAGTGAGIAKVIGVGNQAGLNEVEILQFLRDDPDTCAVACYLESITDGDAFVKAAEAVSERKPVVVLRGGVSVPGRRAVTIHSGRQAGDDEAYGAAFKRAGLLRAESFEGLCDAVLVCATQPLPEGRRLGILSNAGGPGVVAADAADRAGLEVPLLSPATMKRLADTLPPDATIGNPTDLRGEATPSRVAAALETVQGDPDLDAAVVVITPHGMVEPEDTADAIAAVARSKPVVAALLGGRHGEEARRRLCTAGMAALPSPERAVAALRALVEYAAWRRRPPRIVTRFPVNRHRVDRILRRHARAGRSSVGEMDAKAILRAYDFAVPQGLAARSAEEAAEAALRIGLPVAMKIMSPQIVRKTDIGGVQLGLSTCGQVHDAYDLMMARIALKVPEAVLEGVYIEAMCGEGREVILGMKRDPQFGPMLMFGLGGILVEVMEDVSFYLAPITEDEALQMLSQTRSFPLLQASSGLASVDPLAIARGLQRLSQLATDFPVIQSIDINPFIVRGSGESPLVADARMVLKEAPADAT